MNNTPPHAHARWLATVYFIYFFCGLTLCFEGSFNPEFKEYFQLGYQQQMYTLFAKNIPFVMALAIGCWAPWIGFKRCLTLGLLLFSAGTLLLVPALQAPSYGLVLVAFFIIGLGFNFQLVAGNPLLSSLGPPEGSASRLNLGNALGAIAQILGPITLTLIIPAQAASVQDKLPYIQGLFIVIGLLLVGTAIYTMAGVGSKPVGVDRNCPGSRSGAPNPPKIWKRPRIWLGFITIFFVLGAEAGLFGLFRNYLEDPHIAGFTSIQSQRWFTVYFAMFALGRLVGAAVQKRVKPARTLAFNLMAALTLLGVIVFAKGIPAVVAVVAIGFFVSIFFPTLYALAIDGLGEQTAQASGLLTMGFLGCALLPVLQGWLADRWGLQASYLLWFGPYLLALFYALKGHLLK